MIIRRCLGVVCVMGMLVRTPTEESQLRPRYRGVGKRGDHHQQQVSAMRVETWTDDQRNISLQIIAFYTIIINASTTVCSFKAL
jgi:hypothetical protein